MAARTAARIGVIALCATAGAAARGQDDGIEWVTIGDVNNPAYEDPRGGLVDGRGSVAYEYRIGEYEVTTAQWMEFVNTFSTQSDDFTHFASPIFWGAEPDPTYGGPGRRWRLRDDVADPEMLPVGGISWRESAMFCNWLHNNKSPGLSAIEDGAYDTSTFGMNDDGTFTDQLTHHPDARYWIPTLDEWIKAAHYDPNKHGQGEGGWWLYPITSDEPPVYDVPGNGQANAGFELDYWGEWDIPLGAYVGAQSPWGLLDAAGGAYEWLEEPLSNIDRGLDGSNAGSNLFTAEWADNLAQFRSTKPWDPAPSSAGLRVVSIPSPPSALLLLGVCLVDRRRYAIRETWE